MQQHNLDAEIERLARVWDATQRNDRKPIVRSQHVADVADPDESDARRYGIGLGSVDGHLRPLLPGGFTVVGARQGQGKTSLAEMIAFHNALDHVVAFATLEMPPEDLRERMLGRLMRVSLDDVSALRRSGAATYESALNRLALRRLHLFHPRGEEPRGVDAIIAFAAHTKADVVVIDHARVIDGWEPGSKGPASIVRRLSQWAKDSRTQVVLCCQLNRGAQSKRPSIADLQDTGRLEQEADKVILLWRAFVGTSRDDVCELAVAKNRRGPEFRTHLRWYGPTTTFFDPLDAAEEAVLARCCTKQAPAEETVSIAQPYRNGHSVAHVTESSYDEELWPT